MSLSDELQDSGVDLARTAALSDGVIAIAMTLLVFNLKVPEIEFEEAPQKLLQQLINQLPSFTSFVVSFFVIAIFWVAHHRLFRYFTGFDRKLLWKNLYFLMGISFIPFTAALPGRFPNAFPANALYFANLSLVALALNALWRYANSSGLTDPSASTELRHYMNMRGIIPPIMFALSIPLSYFEWRVALLPAVLIPLVMGIVHRRFARQEAKVP